RTSCDPELGAIFAQNTFDPEFADWVAFTALSERVIGHTGDRREFIGRNGAPSAPAALARTVSASGSASARSSLRGAVGVGLDPCAALQCAIPRRASSSRDTVTLGARSRLSPGPWPVGRNGFR